MAIMRSGNIVGIVSAVKPSKEELNPRILRGGKAQNVRKRYYGKYKRYYIQRTPSD